MTPQDFERSMLDAAPPAGSGLALQAIWWAGKGDWDRAHGCAQQRDGDADCDLVHAYLHRLEGDMSNAGYWYRRAKREFPSISLPDEWRQIAQRLLEPPASAAVPAASPMPPLG